MVGRRRGVSSHPSYLIDNKLALGIPCIFFHLSLWSLCRHARYIYLEDFDLMILLDSWLFISSLLTLMFFAKAGEVFFFFKNYVHTVRGAKLKGLSTLALRGSVTDVIFVKCCS